MAKKLSWDETAQLLGQLGSERHLAERIEAERKRRGWSQERLAKEMSDAGCPIPQSAISKIEKPPPGVGRRAITVDEALAFARVLDVDIAALLLPQQARSDQQLIRDVAAGPELAKNLCRAEDAYRAVVERVAERLRRDRDLIRPFVVTAEEGGRLENRDSIAGRFYRDVLERVPEVEEDK